MRLIHLILFLTYSCTCVGQDNLHVDTAIHSFPSVNRDSQISVQALSNPSSSKKKSIRKQVQRPKIKQEAPILSIELVPEKKNGDRKYNGFIIALLLSTIVFFLVVFRSKFFSNNTNRPSNSQGKESISDFLARTYWRCVFCGDKVTQVHHKKYAKYNIGKEPIEWLVSVCKTCHDSQHLA